MAKGTPATDAVRRAGVVHRLHEYEPAARGADDIRARTDRSGYGLEAAAALGLDPARVLKTLIASVDGRLVAAIVPADRELDLKRLAAVAGGRRAAMAEPAVAERATGYVVGGISPLGQRRGLWTVVDDGAAVHSTVLVSGGRRGLQLELAPDDLVALTGATVAPISR